MPQIATLPAPNRDKLDQALKKQKTVTKAKERVKFLKKRDNLLQRIPPLPKYQLMEIEYRVAISYLPNNIEITLYLVFSLI